MREHPHSGPPRAAPRFLVVGEGGLSVELGEDIDAQVNARVHLLAARVRAAFPRAEVVPSYRALLILFDPLRLARSELQAQVLALLADLPDDAPVEGRVVRVPVWYGGPFGPDLPEVAAHAGLAVDEAIALHAGAECRVFQLGFSPGFPYLGGMPARLAMPRLDAPRPRVPAGSVGIAGPQTGIYPVESPGGWRLIGRTPLPLFEPHAPRPFLFAPGDRVRFEPIDGARFAALEAEVRDGWRPPREEPAR